VEPANLHFAISGAVFALMATFFLTITIACYTNSTRVLRSKYFVLCPFPDHLGISLRRMFAEIGVRPSNDAINETRLIIPAASILVFDVVIINDHLLCSMAVDT